MKKLVLSMSIGLFLLAGCSTEKPDTQIEEITGDKAFVLNSDGVNLVLNEVSLDAIQRNQSNTNATSARGNSAHTHGDYNHDILIVTWSGTQNEGGTHGSGAGEFILGPPFESIYFTMETECVLVEGNEAVYGGTFTDVQNNPFPPGGPFELGNIFYFKVIDNGQGINAPTDQHAIGGLVVPGGTSFCGTFPVSDPFWERFGLLDVAEPGSVKVNN